MIVPQVSSAYDFPQMHFADSQFIHIHVLVMSKKGTDIFTELV